jgi:uncharacterized protein YlxW (UPF0749 family)
MPDSPYQRLPEHVTLPLLTLVTRQSLDQDYAFVAERRAKGEEQPPSRRGLVALVVVLVGFGVLVSTAAAQTSRNAQVDETSRASLVREITDKRAVLTRQQDRIAALQADVTEARTADQSAAEAEGQATQRLNGVKARTGYGSVRGAGVRIVVDDAPGTDAATVRDSDLALLVDALWGVGAEAISINNQRLTTLSAIRNANVAIHVNGRPLAPPYVVEAIGDPLTLQARFGDSARGQRFLALVGGLKFGFDISNQDDLELPSASLPALRYATADTSVDNGAATKEDTP